MIISVMGSGTFGCALANHLANKGFDIRLWGRDDSITRSIFETRCLPHSLGEEELNKNINMTFNLDEALSGSEVILLVVPSVAIRVVCEQIKPYYKDQIIVIATKGLEDKTYYTMDEIVKEVLETDKIVALSGPTHAEEVVLGLPSSCVAGSENHDLAMIVQDIFMSEVFRVYTSDDIKGVELGGALKNIIALAAGISDGVGYGDNAKAALITRGIVEITRLGIALGAKAETFGGLTGIGDLIVTCASVHSRNRMAGFLIGEGKTLKEALDTVGMVVEGVNALQAAYSQAKTLDVEAPIINTVHAILYEGLSVDDAAYILINRKKKKENTK